MFLGSRPVSLNVSAPAGIPSPWECESMKTAPAKGLAGREQFLCDVS